MSIMDYFDTVRAFDDFGVDEMMRLRPFNSEVIFMIVRPATPGRPPAERWGVEIALLFDVTLLSRADVSRD